jgi:hypothetical protein
MVTVGGHRRARRLARTAASAGKSDRMIRLLGLTGVLFGDSTRRRVFEPLIADWQRELHAASSTPARARIFLSGSAAFGVTLISCLFTEGVAMPRAALVKALAGLTVSTLLLVVIQIALNAAAFRNSFPLEMRFWMALPMILPLAIPLAMLPVLMLIRGTGRATSRGAAKLIATGAILTYITAGWLTPLMRGDVRDELYLEMERRVTADEQAGRVFYPLTAARQARPMTPEERLVAREQWRQSPQYLAAQAAQTRPRWGRTTIVTAALALALGALGWGLGSLRRASASRAAAWWVLAWFSLMILDGRFLYPGNGVSQYIGRAPYWVPLAVFATAAALTLVENRRRTAAHALNP